MEFRTHELIGLFTCLVRQEMLYHGNQYFRKLNFAFWNNSE